MAPLCRLLSFWVWVWTRPRPPAYYAGRSWRGDMLLALRRRRVVLLALAKLEVALAPRSAVPLAGG